MAFELKMPQLGLTMEEGTLSKWIKHEGDTVKAGDVVAEITTDKLTNELTSEQDGVLLKIVAQEGDDVPVKGTLAWIGQPGELVGAAPTVAAAPRRRRLRCPREEGRDKRDCHRRRARRVCGGDPRRAARGAGHRYRKAVSGRHLPERGLHPHQVPAALGGARLPD